MEPTPYSPQNHQIMATLTTEQIEAKKQQLKQLTEQVKTIVNELKEAGAWPLSEDDLDDVAGGFSSSYAAKFPQIKGY